MFKTFSKLFDLLDRREKLQALVLLALMLAVGLVEMVGVASIFPLIAVISNPALIESNQYLRWTYETLRFTDDNSFFIFLAAAVFLIVVTRIGFTAISSYGLLRYAQMRSHVLSVKLLSSYLRRPYTWFLQRHTADMGKSVLAEVDQVIIESLMPALQFVSSLIIVGFIVGLILAVEPVVATSALIGVSLAYGIIYLAISKVVRGLGRDRNASNRFRYQIAQDVLGGVKEVKIGGLERGYLRRYARASYRFAQLRTYFVLAREMPRHLLELIAIASILTVMLVLLLRADGKLSTALPVIALYAFAGLRLLPAVQTIYKSIVSLRFGGSALEALHDELASSENVADFTQVAPLPLRREITVDNVSFAFPQTERPAINSVSLTIPVNTTVGLVGTTGAGKSTLVDVIIGLLEPQDGRLCVDGQVIDRGNVRSWQRSVGYVPQQIFLADESIAANIAFGLPPELIDMAAVEHASRMAMLHDFIVTQLPEGYETEVGERGMRLSGGQRQRIGIARALYHDPDVLILDEATSALDNVTENAVIEAVNGLSRRKTIIMIAHRLTTMKGCDSIFSMEMGTLKSVDFETLAGEIA